MVSTDVFLTLAGNMFSIERKFNVSSNRRYRALFGVSPYVTAKVWILARTSIPRGGLPFHLLWALHFLKCYCTEANNAGIWGCDEKTHRKWTWTFVKIISKLKLVCNINQSIFFLNFQP